jgi:hypothetical protein
MKYHLPGGPNNKFMRRVMFLLATILSLQIINILWAMRKVVLGVF